LAPARITSGAVRHSSAAHGAVLSDADETDAGVASGVNNAIARIAGLLVITAVGAVVAAQFSLELDRRLSTRADP
jgi:hypothetical protein